MKKFYLLLMVFPTVLFAQQNMTVTNIEADQILKGAFNPLNYTSANPITQPLAIFQGIENRVNADSLKTNIIKLSSFKNRNSGSDTISTTIGFGAARNWVYSRFEDYSTQNENRLIPSFLAFDQSICFMTKHKDVFAVLPGTDTTNHQILIIEGHMDSRCATLCDTACVAEGVEDNASGTALVMELARVMSAYSYPQTVVFLITTAEEQGLFGAVAFAAYCQNNDLELKAVLNNDVIGGIACGQTSSAPSCPGLDDIDSLQVRLFSQGNFNSPSKQLSRFIKLQYMEELKALSAVPMSVTIMTAEDRTGRGGDHIPFRQRGFPAMRFTSANEHGDASNGSGYTDRQHTSDDVLGVDTNNDQIIDSFFVDFNYLARNAKINGVAASVAVLGPNTPSFAVVGVQGPGLQVDIAPAAPAPKYRIAVRTTTNDWDSVYTATTSSITIFPPTAATYYVSVASVDNDNLESLFSDEKMINTATIGLKEEKNSGKGIELMQNRPNPFDEATFISVRAGSDMKNKKAIIKVYDANGKQIEKMVMTLEEGMNEVIYEHGYGQVGVFIYTLELDGKVIDSKRMVFAN
jgi:hypothetical protein